MAGINIPGVGPKLFCATEDNKLWWRDPVGHEVNWQHIGHANGVVAMTAARGKLFCTTPAEPDIDDVELISKQGSVVTKRVRPGDWRTLETTFNQPVVAVFRSPAGARIKVSKWLFSTDEQELDGMTNKALRTSLGKIQILVRETAEITYAWNPDGPPGEIIKIPLP
jgi:hypothetical protein